MANDPKLPILFEEKKSHKWVIQLKTGNKNYQFDLVKGDYIGRNEPDKDIDFISRTTLIHPNYKGPEVFQLITYGMELFKPLIDAYYEPGKHTIETELLDSNNSSITKILYENITITSLSAGNLDLVNPRDIHEGELTITFDKATYLY